MNTQTDSHDAWILTYDTSDPARQPLCEALYTVGNGISPCGA
jgi:hypothetical protein